jgi:N-methylhydantoinase A
VAAGERLTGAGIEAVAICFLNSYRNPAHERRAEDILRATFPQLLVTASYAVLPERKEYERTSTTVVNAYLLAAMRAYLSNLESGLRAIGINAPVRVITSNGGMLAATSARESPVFVVASGPAGGVIARHGWVVPAASPTSSSSTWAVPPPRRWSWRPGAPA